MVDAGKALNVHSGMFGKPLGFSNVHFTAQTTNLGSERDNNH